VFNVRPFEEKPMTIRPLYDRVLVRRKEPEVKSRGGLFLPSAAQEKSQLAEVIAVGQGRLNDDGSVTALKIEPGMTVLLAKWGGDEIEVGGEKQMLVRESDILGVVG
jgi:chaperonin GroES